MIKGRKKDSLIEVIFKFLESYLGLIEVSVKESSVLILKKLIAMSIITFLVLCFFTALQATLISAIRLYSDIHWLYIFLIVDAELLFIIIAIWFSRSLLKRFIDRWFEK